MEAGSSSRYTHYSSSFNAWLTRQQQDLEELINGAASHANDPDKLRSLVEKDIHHFEEYREVRLQLFQQDALAFLCPAWCTTLENVLHWIGGYRPSMAIRLVYSLVGSELDAPFEQYLKGERNGTLSGTLSEISSAQMDQINSLHMKILREEDKISSRMASLQDDVLDESLATISKELSRVGEPREMADRALVGHVSSLGVMLSEADKLRVSTLKELREILTPLQAVDMLICTKKLLLSLHKWGQRWDLEKGNCR
ncbi:hypothetical protein SAY86_029380 [Trapa natans]|uniref:DOG1 domain-containing protein n=1 Tax=Trapa natans TaxID=22666 RepID=A0AAN7M3K3_TRANT|nr:hypothetical protein SAY86_029380 [Trapa natans]